MTILSRPFPMILTALCLALIARCETESGAGKDMRDTISSDTAVIVTVSAADASDVPPPATECPDEEETPFALAVTTAAFGDDTTIELPKGAPSDGGLYDFHVHSITSEEVGFGGVTTLVKWILSDSGDMLTLKFLGQYLQTAIPTMLLDAFDLLAHGEQGEPVVELHTCTYVCDLAECAVCEELLCSTTTTVTGVVYLAGDWVLVSPDVITVPPHEVEFLAGQKGRELFTLFGGYGGEIVGTSIAFITGIFEFHGIIDVSKNEAEGYILNAKSGEHMGLWKAYRKTLIANPPEA